MNKLNPSIKHHLYIGAFISLWIFVFAFFIKPFDDGTVHQWTGISIGFSLITFVCYGITALIQKAVYQIQLKWNIAFELAILFVFYLFFSSISYLFYRSPILYGSYDFLEFSTKIILTTSLTLTPILVLGRLFVTRLTSAPLKEDDTIIIKGESKLDILKISKSVLVCVSSAQNYVEIFYLLNGQLSSKVFRSSLKKIQRDADFLIQVHRSHLINPSHFISWKEKNIVSLTQIEIPVSKRYKNNISLS